MAKAKTAAQSSRAAARARARELRRSGHSRLADAFEDFADGITDGKSFSLADYLDDPDIEGANAARRADAENEPRNAAGFVSDAAPRPEGDADPGAVPSELALADAVSDAVSDAGAHPDD